MILPRANRGCSSTPCTNRSTSKLDDFGTDQQLDRQARKHRRNHADQ